MPYYLSANITSSFRKVFSILNLAVANIYFNEFVKNDGRQFGLLLSQKYSKQGDVFINLVILLSELEENKTLIEIIAMGGAPVSQTMTDIFRNSANEILEVLKQRNLELEIIEENPHLFREFTD